MDDAPVAYVMLVGFHHTLGPQVDLSLPALPAAKKQSNVVGASPYSLPHEWRFLPFLALPDGIHHRNSDFSFFMLEAVPEDAIVANTPLYGVSFYRQIRASVRHIYFFFSESRAHAASQELSTRTADITRSSVQKAVVVLLRQPLFGVICSKLDIVSAALFNERDFSQTAILHEFERHLIGTSNATTPHGDSSLFYVGPPFFFLFMSFCVISASIN